MLKNVLSVEKVVKIIFSFLFLKQFLKHYFKRIKRETRENMKNLFTINNVYNHLKGG